MGRNKKRERMNSNYIFISCVFLQKEKKAQRKTSREPYKKDVKSKEIA